MVVRTTQHLKTAQNPDKMALGQVIEALPKHNLARQIELYVRHGLYINAASCLMEERSPSIIRKTLEQLKTIEKETKDQSTELNAAIAILQELKGEHNQARKRANEILDFFESVKEILLTIEISEETDGNGRECCLMAYHAAIVFSLINKMESKRIADFLAGDGMEIVENDDCEFDFGDLPKEKVRMPNEMEYRFAIRIYRQIGSHEEAEKCMANAEDNGITFSHARIENKMADEYHIPQDALGRYTSRINAIKKYLEDNPDCSYGEVRKLIAGADWDYRQVLIKAGKIISELDYQIEHEHWSAAMESKEELAEISREIRNPDLCRAINERIEKIAHNCAKSERPQERIIALENFIELMRMTEAIEILFWFAKQDLWMEFTRGLKKFEAVKENTWTKVERNRLLHIGREIEADEPKAAYWIHLLTGNVAAAFRLAPIAAAREELWTERKHIYEQMRERGAGIEVLNKISRRLRII